MTETEAKYFKELHKQRKEIADILEKPAARGAKDRVADQYSEQAHFIYELLQNADDAGATQVRFDLNHERLVFVHNGTRHFSLSNPDTEDEDGAKGRLGDINAITSIGNSNKKESSIGKFGVGFKSVFQYTDTPEIYDKEFCFKIESFLVPSLLNKDFTGRKPDETVFVFPLEAKGKNSSASYKDISTKLSSLNYPLLFLSGLNQIEYKTRNSVGSYFKRVSNEYEFAGTKVELVSVGSIKESAKQKEDIWVFSRGENSYDRYSVGYFLDTEKNKLKPKKLPAFCFFPTREATGLNFIIHAPFLLNQSREGLKVNEEHNSLMISNLAILAADSLEYFIKIEKTLSVRYMDDSILNIIPYDIDVEEDKISFFPFYQEVLRKYKKCRILPTQTGYTTSNHAYWANTTDLPIVFTDEQLSRMVKDRYSHWVFVTKGRLELYRNDSELADFITEIVNSYVDEDTIFDGRELYDYDSLSKQNWEGDELPGITDKLIESQSIAWLLKFYEWISLDTRRRSRAKVKPYFLDSNSKAVPLFDFNGNEVLFLPVKGVQNYHKIHSDLLANPECRAFLESMGIKKPSMIERIRIEVVPLYEKGIPINVDEHFMLFFNYYCECPTAECDSFIELIKTIPFIACEDGLSFDSGPDVYFPTNDLKGFLCGKEEVHFIDFSLYEKKVEKHYRKQLRQFLSELGVVSEIAVKERDIDSYVARISYFRGIPCTYVFWAKMYYVDGLAELVDYIVTNSDIDKSRLLWNSLVHLISEKNAKNPSLKEMLKVSSKYQYYNYFYRDFPGESTDFSLLLEKKWIVNSAGVFVSPSEVDTGHLDALYEKETSAAKALIADLGIFDEYSTKMLEAMPSAQKSRYLLGAKCAELGITEEELEALAAQKKRDLNGCSTHQATEYSESNRNAGSSHPIHFDNDEAWDGGTLKVMKDIVAKTETSDKAKKKRIYKEEKEISSDDYVPDLIDYTKRIENEKQRSAFAIQNIAYMEKLQNIIANAEKYSYLWFKTLLELEIINPDRAKPSGNEIAIAFDSVDKEEGSKHTLILSNPDRGIPLAIEEMTDIPLELSFNDNTTKTLVIDGASVQSFTMRAKIRNSMNLNEIDFSSVFKASIVTKSPVFLLGELQKSIQKLDLDDSFNLKTHLTNSIEFIFGPPGTGKTTYLAKNVIAKYMADVKPLRVLVLTPTNKAADVLVDRIIGLNWKKREYEDWLCRFGTTPDERIGESVVFRDKNNPKLRAKKNVTVTTIHRFPYDYYINSNNRFFLRDQKWDYVVIDEASMIPLVYIIYVLYRVKTHFIIAGDPFQIEPIASVDTWKDENIYKMVKLNSFTNPRTEPINYPVKLLTTQYRSVPSIGTVFSKFAYGGVLQHSRAEYSASTTRLNQEKYLPPLSIISFPVSRYESIYKAKQIEKSSSFQIYSALLMYECINNLSKRLVANNPGKEYSIGVIAPYRAEADLISKLIQSENFPKAVKVDVGTIHGFQGDECDIVFVVLNTPPNKMQSSSMFLNKINILNVAISRARNHLILVMPDENTENIENLRLVERLKTLMTSNDECKTVSASEIEEQIFGTANFLEKNSFVTGHQTVNVYGLPERVYEIRVEDSAVDVQIHRHLDTEVINNSGRQPAISFESSEVIPDKEDKTTDYPDRVVKPDAFDEAKIEDIVPSCIQAGEDIELSKSTDSTSEVIPDDIAPEVDSSKKVIHIEEPQKVNRDIRVTYNLLTEKQRKVAFKGHKLNIPNSEYLIIPSGKKTVDGIALFTGKLSFIGNNKNEYIVRYSGLFHLIFINNSEATKEFRAAVAKGFILTRIN